MNKKINIKSLANGTLVTIRNGNKKSISRRFATISDAIDFILPQGNRRTELHINGYRTVLAGWVL